MMKPKKIIKAKTTWVMDTYDGCKIQLSTRVCAPGEKFLVLSHAFWLGESFMGCLVQSSIGIEMINGYVVSGDVYDYLVRRYFEEIK
jgi:hypothetical protein